MSSGTGHVHSPLLFPRKKRNASYYLKVGIDDYDEELDDNGNYETENNTGTTTTKRNNIILEAAEATTRKRKNNRNNNNNSSSNNNIVTFIAVSALVSLVISISVSLSIIFFYNQSYLVKSDEAITTIQIEGVACWDINENGNCDLGSEDINSSGTCTAADCLPSTDNYVTTNTDQTISSVKTFGSAPIAPSYTATATTNQLLLGTTRTITLNAPTPATSSRIVTLPDPGADCNLILSESAQTINGIKTLGSAPIAPSYTATATTNQLLLGTTRTATINVPTPATLSRVYTVPDPAADASFVMTESPQTINGVKTFGSAPIAPSYTAIATTNQLLLGTTRTITINAPTPAGSSRVVTLPDPGADCNLILSESAQTINGVKTLGSAPIAPSYTATATTNQLLLGTTRTATINAPTPAGSSRVYTVPDPSADASFVMTESDQTINGLKTLGTGLKFPGLAGGTPTTLNNYEEATGTLNFSGAATFSCTFNVVSIGKFVIFMIGTGSATASGGASALTSTAEIPTRYRPTTNFYSITRVTSNSVELSGLIELQSNGNVVAYSSAGGANFAATGTDRIWRCFISYTLQ